MQSIMEQRAGQDRRSAAAVVLHAVRLEMGISQQSAAHSNDLQGSLWSKYETGRAKPYSLDVTMRFKHWSGGDVTPEMWSEAPTRAQLARLNAARLNARKPRAEAAA